MKEKKPVTPQVPALPGMTPLGIRPQVRRYFIEHKRFGHSWRREDVLELFTDLNELERRRMSAHYKGLEATRIRELLPNGEVR